MIHERARAGERVCLAVNLSAKSFTDPDFADVISEALASGSVDPRVLTFEVTETAAIADLEQARTFMSRLRGLGCRFALDDFGVGFSSLYHLKHLPVDDLKIDGAFIASLPDDAVDQHLVKGIVEVARGLQKRTVAEFVGDDETLTLLRDYGVDLAQGYHVGRPRPIHEVLGIEQDVPKHRQR